MGPGGSRGLQSRCEARRTSWMCSIRMHLRQQSKSDPVGSLFLLRSKSKTLLDGRPSPIGKTFGIRFGKVIFPTLIAQAHGRQHGSNHATENDRRSVRAGLPLRLRLGDDARQQGDRGNDLAEITLGHDVRVREGVQEVHLARMKQKGIEKGLDGVIKPLV